MVTTVKSRPFRPGDVVRMRGTGEIREVWANAPERYHYWTWKDGECVEVHKTDIELVEPYARPLRRDLLALEQEQEREQEQEQS